MKHFFASLFAAVLVALFLAQVKKVLIVNNATNVFSGTKKTFTPWTVVCSPENKFAPVGPYGTVSTVVFDSYEEAMMLRDRMWLTHSNIERNLRQEVYAPEWKECK